MGKIHEPKILILFDIIGFSITHLFCLFNLHEQAGESNILEKGIQRADHPAKFSAGVVYIHLLGLLSILHAIFQFPT